MVSNAQLRQRRQAAVPSGVGNIHSVYADRAENALVWDVEGKRYIDFAGGIGVLNTGHRHPAVMAAVAAQAERFTHTCFHVMPYEPYVALAERLNALAPGDAAKKTLLVNTGAEAVENAVKIARAYTRRSAVIAFGGGFHGRTLLAASLTGKVVPYKRGFGPFPAEIFHARFPNALHGVSVDDALSSIEAIFKCDVEPERVAAIIVEPVQGEGGFYPAPTAFLRRLRELTERHGIVLIVDEVQSGFGRTGKFFAAEHADIEPDLITSAKSLAGGFPLAAVTGKAEIMDAPGPGGLGGTYGGNPLSCAAALAVIEVIESQGLLARSEAIGRLARERLQALKSRFDCIGDVRNLGAMVAFELFESGDLQKPAAELTRALLQKTEQEGLILISCGVYANVVRILVPLTASDEEVSEGLDIIERCLAELLTVQ